MEFGLVQKLRQASRLRDDGRLDEAEHLYREVLALAPEDTNALHFLGLIEFRRGNVEAALALIGRAIAAAPDNIGAIYNQANMLRDTGRLQEAIASCDSVLALAPGDPVTLNNRGAILFDLKRYEDALADYDRGLARAPADVSLLNNRGNALLAFERYQDALQSYDRALAIEPRLANALFGRANALMSLGRLEDALLSYDRTLAIDPSRTDAHANRGYILSRLKRNQEALAAYDRAIELNPSLAMLHMHRGEILFDLRRAQEAVLAFDRAFGIDPALDYVEGARLLTKMYVCDWSNLAFERERLVGNVLQGKPAANPFSFLSVGRTPGEQWLCAKAYAQKLYKPSATPLWRGEHYRHRKIKLAYLSGEFREQATAYLAAGIFECHNRSEFELYAVSTGLNDNSPMRKRVEAAFDIFLDVRGQPDREVAERIRAAEIDILVNLNGFFGEERTGLAAFRPSPLQVNYLGYPGTMGAPYMDYILADGWVIPEADRENYSERVIYLPDSYQANDRTKVIGGDTRTRDAYGLPERGFVFSSFNNAYKITPEIFDVWMRLLKEIDGSVLWLLELDSAARRNLAIEAEKRGVARNRIVFAPFVKLQDHLARGRHADLFLDTLPVNAHTTASDALWSGVPVLTCLGSTFPGRVAASLLAAMGLEDMITRSLDEYEALALRLARDPALLSAIRARLGRNRDSHPLFDTPRLARHIETAYRTIQDRHQRGLAPESFAVTGE